ncbi:MAG: hypothetical protein ACREIC_24405, partial [Limisphaerales bacterium]
MNDEIPFPPDALTWTIKLDPLATGPAVGETRVNSSVGPGPFSCKVMVTTAALLELSLAVIVATKGPPSGETFVSGIANTFVTATPGDSA